MEKMKNFIYKNFTNWIQIFLETSLWNQNLPFYRFLSIGNTKWLQFVAWIVILNYHFNKNLNWRKITQKVNKFMPNNTCSHKTITLDNSWKKIKKKIFIGLNSTLNELLNDQQKHIE